LDNAKPINVQKRLEILYRVAILDQVLQPGGQYGGSAGPAQVSGQTCSSDVTRFESRRVRHLHNNHRVMTSGSRDRSPLVHRTGGGLMTDSGGRPHQAGITRCPNGLTRPSLHPPDFTAWCKKHENHDAQLVPEHDRSGTADLV